MSFEEFYLQHEHLVRSVIGRQVGGGHEADHDDLFQNTMVKAWRSYHKMDGSNPSGWVYRIAYNVAIDYLRHLKRRMPIDGYLDEEVCAATIADDSLAESLDPIYSGLYEAIEQAFRQLDKKDQQIIFLLVRNYKIREISARLGIASKDVTYRRILRARENFALHYRLVAKIDTYVL